MTMHSKHFVPHNLAHVTRYTAANGKFVHTYCLFLPIVNDTTFSGCNEPLRLFICPMLPRQDSYTHL